MNVKIQNRHLQVSQNLKRVIDRQAGKLKRLLPTFASEDLDLHITLEKLPRGKQYHSVLVLTMPQNTIRVEEIRNNISTSVLEAFEELLRRVQKFKSHLNRKHLWQKESAAAMAVPAPETAEEFQSAISQHWGQVENYVRRELFHTAMIESLPADLLQVQAVMDDIFLELADGARHRPEDIPLPHWVFQVARQKVRNRLEQLQDAREEPHVEERPRAQSRWDDEVLNFYQPDEALRLEDLLQDENSVSPEELLQREEMQEQLQRAIARLPVSVRDSFVLFALEGFNSDEIAMITGKTPSQVVEEVETARMELRQFRQQLQS